MINNLYASKKYNATTEATSTRKTKQVVMLYDGIIKFLNEVKSAIENKNYEARYNLTEKINKVINGLHTCLDHEKGKDIAITLENFYTSMFIRVTDLNFEKDPQKATQSCLQLINEFKLMRDAWQTVDEKVVSGEIENLKECTNKVDNNSSDNDSYKSNNIEIST